MLLLHLIFIPLVIIFAQRRSATIIRNVQNTQTKQNPQEIKRKVLQKYYIFIVENINTLGHDAYDVALLLLPLLKLVTKQTQRKVKGNCERRIGQIESLQRINNKKMYLEEEKNHLHKHNTHEHS